MKKRKLRLNKLMLLFLSIITFGLFMIPISFAKPYENIGQLDNVNRITGITTDVSNSSNVPVKLYINNDNYTQSAKRYTIQCFSVNDLNTPVNIMSLSGCTGVYFVLPNGAQRATTSYTSNNNYAQYYSGTEFMNYCRIDFSSIAYANILQDYVFNITLSPNASTIGAFVGNTYYNIGGENNLGVFQYFRVELWQQYVSTTGGEDVSTQVLSFNKFQFNEPLLSQIASTNDSNTYQYSIRIYFNGKQIEALPQFNLRYLELTSIMARNIEYTTYSSARSSLPWLSNNMQLYNTDATFFNSGWNDATNANRYDTIQWVQFRIADYTFKSSSYYSSSIGIKGYLSNTYFTSLSSTEVLVSNESFQNGFDSGYGEGYINGFATATAQHSNSFGDMIMWVADVPVHIIYSLLNFNILGTNLMSLFTAIITLFMFIWLVRKFRE